MENWKFYWFMAAFMLAAFLFMVAGCTPKF